MKSIHDASPIARTESAADPGTPVVLDRHAELEQLGRRWTRALVERDVDSLRMLVADDGVLLRPGAPSVQGKQEIARAWRDWFACDGFSLELEPRRLSVYPHGDIAHDVSRYRLRYRNGGRRPVFDHGDHLIVWENRDGAWRVRSNIFYSRNLLEISG